MEIYNIVVQAPTEEELRAFIKAVSDHYFVSQPLLGKATQYKVHFGRLNLSSSNFLYLVGIPGYTDTEFIWERFADNLLGFIFLTDATNQTSLKAVKDSIANTKSLGEMPYVAAVVKKDAQAELASLKKELNVAEERFFVCEPLEKMQIKKVINGLLNQGIKVIRKRSA